MIRTSFLSSLATFMFLCSALHSFTNPEQLFDHRVISETIVSDSPYLIKSSSLDKIYLDEERILASFEGHFGFDLILDSGETLYIPFMLVDENGPFLIHAKGSAEETPNTKPAGLFKNICNACKYEWSGGCIVLRCPRCGSRDFQSNVPNW